MGRIRRWAGLRVVSLVVAALALLLMTGVSASSAVVRSAPAATPVQMNYACTSKITGLMRYVSSLSDCTKAENAVTIVPGPEYVCIYLDFFVRQVASSKDCPSSTNLKEVTLPPTLSGPVYFCALKIGGLLTYTTNPGSCNTKLQFPVVVPHQPPVLANIETTPLSYQSQSPPVAVSSTLTVSDAGDSTVAGATVSITSGFSSSSDDTLSFTNQNGITGSYDSSTGVLTLSGDASIADYQAALRSVEFSTSDSSASPAARTVSFQVTDTNSQTSNTESRTIDVTAAAPPPPCATCG
jgi:hypothetical protein